MDDLSTIIHQSQYSCILRKARYPTGPLIATTRELEDSGLTEENALHIRTAQVVLANYDLLQSDFLELSSASLRERHPWIAKRSADAQKTLIERLIDRWLVDNAAFISTSQAAQSVVNSPIETDGTTRLAFRPSGYGRALLVPVAADSAGETGGARLLDIKGAGVSAKTRPHPGEHSDGLDYVGAALSDYAFQRLIDEIFRRAIPTCWTVPTYAILDLGFDVVGGWYGTSPAGMHVRRAHQRPDGNMDLPLAGSTEEAVKLQIELLLRHYGLTSASPGTAFDIAFDDDELVLIYSNRAVGHLSTAEIDRLRRFRRADEDKIHLEGINLQLAREVGLRPCRAHMVDFGHVNVRETFAYPLISLVRDRLLHIGGVIWPSEDHFINPRPELKVPIEDWKLAALNARFFDVAKQFRRGRVTSAEVTAAVDDFVERTVARWPP